MLPEQIIWLHSIESFLSGTISSGISILSRLDPRNRGVPALTVFQTVSMPLTLQCLSLATAGCLFPIIDKYYWMSVWTSMVCSIPDVCSNNRSSFNHPNIMKLLKETEAWKESKDDILQPNISRKWGVTTMIVNSVPTSTSLLSQPFLISRNPILNDVIATTTKLLPVSKVTLQSLS